MITSDRQLPERASNASAAFLVRGRVVLELELGAAVERVDQPGLGALGADLVGDVDREVAAHRVADLEHVVGADPLASARANR